MNRDMMYSWGMLRKAQTQCHDSGEDNWLYMFTLDKADRSKQSRLSRSPIQA